MRVKCLAQKHNTMIPARARISLLYPESSMLTVRLLHLPGPKYHSKADRKNNSYVCCFILNFLPSTEITDCYDNPIGVAEIGKIPDAKMTASSKLGSSYEPWFGRLNGNSGDGWCSKAAATNNEWLKVDLGKLYSVCAVATQGDRNGNEWVTAFKLSFSLDGTSWNVYKGDTNKDVVRTTKF